MTTRPNLPPPPPDDDAVRIEQPELSLPSTASDAEKAAYDLSARLWGLMQQHYFLNRKEDEMEMARITPDEFVITENGITFSILVDVE